jgi:hypothetical protein
MLNSREFYMDLGREEAKARNQRDQARAEFHARHYRAEKALEQGEDRQIADRLYRDAYAEERRT